MIAVDTSVWIDAQRRNSRTAGPLLELIEADEVMLPLPVRLELRAGIARHQRAQLIRLLTGLPVARPSDETWAQVERWTEQAADAGEHYSLSDLMIAALAEEIGGLVWSLDKDFERMARLKMVRLYG